MNTMRDKHAKDGKKVSHHHEYSSATHVNVQGEWSFAPSLGAKNEDHLRKNNIDVAKFKEALGGTADQPIGEVLVLAAQHTEQTLTH